ncbi:uncharacterized protein UBRO_21067 [Ustilago bromivora]|uniref:Secreted protein n=1 Tax=Ustilago bromivora TaxID=307758 RepID=A0A1K0G3I9_9BASI|nr:uncharacterized protein UBRO_21067 [Ustilago bromivora]
MSLLICIRTLGCLFLQLGITSTAKTAITSKPFSACSWRLLSEICIDHGRSPRRMLHLINMFRQVSPLEGSARENRILRMLTRATSLRKTTRRPFSKDWNLIMTRRMLQ